MTLARDRGRPRAGELDAGLTYLDNEPLPDVARSPLWRERYLLVVDADGPPRRHAVAWARGRARCRCACSRPDMQHRRIVDGAFARPGTPPQPVIETNSISTLFAHARDGLPG